MLRVYYAGQAVAAQPSGSNISVTIATDNSTVEMVFPSNIAAKVNHNMAVNSFPTSSERALVVRILLYTFVSTITNNFTELFLTKIGEGTGNFLPPV
jgi:hypothetical protein